MNPVLNIRKGIQIELCNEILHAPMHPLSMPVCYTHHCVILKNGIFALTASTVVVVLYESKVLLVSFICFCPTDEQTLVTIIRANLSSFFGLHFCVYLLLYAGLRLVHLKVSQILYSSMYYVFIFIHTVKNEEFLELLSNF